MEHFPKSDFPTKKQKSIFGTVTIINYALNHDKRNCIGPREAARGPRLFLFCIYTKKRRSAALWSSDRSLIGHWLEIPNRSIDL